MNDKLIQKYADLLSLLDGKSVFSYKASAPAQTTSREGLIHMGASGASATSSKDVQEDLNIILPRSKENFYELVYKFPQSNLIKARFRSFFFYINKLSYLKKN
jgi:hypothetical protein